MGSSASCRSTRAGSSPTFRASGPRYSWTSSRIVSVVTTSNVDSRKTRCAARPVAAERRTLASAATLLRGLEVTQHVFLGDAPLLQRAGKFLAEFEKELAAHRHREPLRVGDRIEDTGRLPPASDE